uniref:RING-type domain-containing protein n=1 Tax=Panagrolaimus sp. PS1159 TaxID=55785 RepID=A0AC35FP19_9BILA
MSSLPFSFSPKKCFPAISSTSPIGQCIICYSPLTQSNTYAITKCGHTFHKRCIMHWLKVSQNCATCRVDAVKYDIIKLYIQELNFDDTFATTNESFKKIYGKYFIKQSIEKQVKILHEKKELEMENMMLKETIKELENSNKKKSKNGWFKSLKKSISKKF